ncbi:bifunctional aldolase/short-chain dehydrogenase [Thalassobacillus sp. CUG 92003]|uniref:bifunctional aldolase/short-chain dehydrogenase n=1 Tax=Thalassobacillus sp. CUG 92003 TaxID=2736641 RepID=UPI0015E72920|nr:bifunctional aldolase/short-chain dehydrogenase [Thalassobacillus sp. CUG 92003]
MVVNRWAQEQAATVQTGLDELVYRSNLLGSDRAIANFGGGNTSMKTVEQDFRGRDVNVMWVKGSGSDLATMGRKNFTGLNLDDIHPLLELEEMSDEEMVEYLSHCMIDSKHPRSSIETLLHAFLPFKHVDHTHPDAIISLCCAYNGKEIASEIFGDTFVWVPYVRPGFQLSKMIAEAVETHPQAELVLMEKHGLVTWGDTSTESYEQTLKVIQQAEAYLHQQREGREDFGGKRYDTLNDYQREEVLTSILPAIRGTMNEQNKVLLSHYADDEVMNFVNSHDAAELSQVGAACPDHLVHTKRVPLYIDWDPARQNEETLIAKIKQGITDYISEYEHYFERHATEHDQMMEATPRVLLIPGIGMINSGKNLKMAHVSRDLYYRAIQVMKGSTALGEFVSLSEEESFNVEYWPLEQYKLSLAPPEKELSRQIGFVTGGAGGIGKETVQALLNEGMHVVIADVNGEGAEEASNAFNEQYGSGLTHPVKMDVTEESQVSEALKNTILTYGGVDFVVNNAGLATSNKIENTSLEEWNLNMNVLSTGYFLVSREAFKIWKHQGIGGNMVFVGSKNSVYAGKGAAAYSTAKASEVHLARCLAAEGGEDGIRVNSVLPDAVIQGSKIWDSKWREERAAGYGIAPDEIEEFYKNRTALKVNILPSDIANSIAFFASSKSSKTTGCMITVDGGVPAAFTR